MAPTGGDGLEVACGCVSLLPVVVTPAGDRVVNPDGARMAVTGGDVLEPARRCVSLPIYVPTPAGDRVVNPHATRMVVAGGDGIELACRCFSLPAGVVEAGEPMAVPPRVKPRTLVVLAVSGPQIGAGGRPVSHEQLWRRNRIGGGEDTTQAPTARQPGCSTGGAEYLSAGNTSGGSGSVVRGVARSTFVVMKASPTATALRVSNCDRPHTVAGTRRFRPRVVATDDRATCRRRADVFVAAVCGVQSTRPLEGAEPVRWAGERLRGVPRRATIRRA